MILTIAFSIWWFIILLAGAMSLKTKSKRWLKRVFWLWSRNIKKLLSNSYPERESGGSQLYFQKPWVLSHQRLKQWDSSQSKVKDKSCNISRSRWHRTSNSFQQLWRGDNHLSCYLIADRQSVWQIILATVQPDPRWDTTIKDVGKHAEGWNMSFHWPNGDSLP